MEEIATHSTEKSKLPLRVDKTLKWLEESRDVWKEKTKETKNTLKKQTLATKRAREGRALLEEELQKEKQASYQIQADLQQKELEITRLKAQLAAAEQQIDLLKKKTSSR